MSTLIILALAALGIGAAIINFLRTPKESRYRIAQNVSLEDRLKTLPEGAQAIIIKANKKRALVMRAPIILIGAILAVFSFWVKNTGSSECERLLGLNTIYISILLVCYGLPVGIFIVSLFFLKTGIKTLKTGYFPPLDSVVFSNTIARKGVASTLRGVVLLVLPFFALNIVYLGANLYTEFSKGKSMHDMVQKLEAKCPSRITLRSSGTVFFTQNS